MKDYNCPMQKVLFIDRDGTIIHETEDEKIEKIKKLSFLDEVIYYLREIVDKLDYKLVMVSNQDGLGTPAFPDEEFYPVHNFIMAHLETQGIPFFKVHIDEHFERDNHPNRKPGTGMLQEYFSDEYDLPNSYMIGDRATDIQLAQNLGCKSIYIKSAYSTPYDDADFTTDNWKEIYEYLVSLS